MTRASLAWVTTSPRCCRFAPISREEWLGVGPPKTYSVQCLLAKRKVFLIIHELSVPAQTVLNGSLMQFSDAAAADPSMSAAPSRG